MGGPTQENGAGAPPIDINALSAPDLRGLMVALGLPVAEHMTPQEAEAARALAQVLPDRVWTVLLNPGMTVRLEGAEGFGENSLEASLSRVQVAPGGERSQVLELSASLAVEAGLRSEALRSALTPELIDRLPEGSRATVLGWKAAKAVPLEASLEASAGERFTYQAVVPPDVGARIAEGDMGAAPNPADPMGMPVGSSVLIRGEAFTAQSLSARYKWLQFDETTTALEGQGLGIRRVDEHTFEVTTGPMEAMERDSFLGVGYRGFQIGWSKDTRAEDHRIAVAQLDLSTPEGEAAYEAFMSQGLVPERSGPGVVRAGERESFTVDVTTGLRFGTDAASADVSADSSTQATMTRWDNGEIIQETVGHNVKGNAFEVTARLDPEGRPPAQGFDWVVTLNGLTPENASLLGFSYGASEMDPTASENLVADLRFTDSELMGLRDLATDRLRELNPDLAAAIESRRDDVDPYVASEQAFTPLERLVATNTPDEVFRELFVRDTALNTETFELLADLWSAGLNGESQAQDPLPGPLPGAVTIRDAKGAPVFVSAPSASPPLIDTTSPDPAASPPETGRLDDLILPGDTDPATGFVAPPALAAAPAADAAPVVGDMPESGKPPAATSSVPELALPPAEDSSLDDLVLPGGTDPLPGFVTPPTLSAPPAADAAPVVSDTPVPIEPLPPLTVADEPRSPPPAPVEPVPEVGAETPVASADPTSPGTPAAPSYDMRDGLLRLNEEGIGVLGLQTALRELGHDVPTDMRFGPETEQALRNFQSRHGLTVDGIAGPETFAALHPRAGSHMADGLIRQGDQGTGVLGVQTALRQHGHELGTDAVFGPETDRAVREFQRDHGLAVDGIVGPRTSAALVATRHAALSPDQQRHLQLAREQLGPALSACGHSPEQIERICTAAMSLAQQHAERGPVKGFFLSKDGERVAVVQHSPPMSEMGIGAALQRSGEQHLALAQQTALEQGQEALRHGAPGPTTSGRVMA